MKHETTITFVSNDRCVSDPITVPLWSTVTLGCEPNSPMIYMGSRKMILYSGPYQVDGKVHAAPKMHPMPTETRVMSPVMYPARPVKRKRRARTVEVPLWLAITFSILLYMLFAAVLWLAT